MKEYPPTLEIDSIPLRQVIPGSHFYVSSHACVWNAKRQYWEVFVPDPSGHSFISIWNKRTKSNNKHSVSKLVLLVWGPGQSKGKTLALHRSSHKNAFGSLDNCVLNLYWGDFGDNVRDMQREGTLTSYKLSEGERREIFESKESKSLLAKKFKVSRSTIWNIQTSDSTYTLCVSLLRRGCSTYS